MSDIWSFLEGNPFFYAFLVGAYLLGSIPFGLVLGWLFGHGDIRKRGSGNIGATNALRSGGVKLGALTLLCDMLKGLIAVLAGWYWGLSVEAGVLIACAAMIGHIFPVWLGFKGGKGVAVYLGVLLGIYYPLGVGALLIWLIVAFLTRYSSLAALVSVGAVPIIFLVLSMTTAALVFAFMSFLVIFKHRDNIGRLLKGTESKIGKKV